ncbi:hypothetical protein HY637_04220 [Candidatus Woesearchaeota archaeon]|nr:hypothetical protein [Candidatus Woesearchaeota archaeon]
MENVIDPLHFRPEAVTGTKSIITTPFGSISQTQRIGSESAASSANYKTWVASGSTSTRYSLQRYQSNEKPSKEEFEARYSFYGNDWTVDTSYLSTTTKVKDRARETRNGLVVKYIKLLDSGILEVTADSAKRSLGFNYQLMKIGYFDPYPPKPTQASENSHVSILSNRDFEGIIVPATKK